jgi:uncharacterized protein YndB with AHSA1/START domain
MPEAIRQGDIPGVQLRRRQELPVGPLETWRWLTEPQLLARWAAPRAEVVAGPQGGLRLAEAPGPWEEEATTVEWRPPERWVLAFRRPADRWPVATRLVLELSRRATGCEISVLQDGFEHLPLSDGLTIWERYRRRWEEALHRLASALAA